MGIKRERKGGWIYQYNEINTKGAGKDSVTDSQKVPDSSFINSTILNSSFSLIGSSLLTKNSIIFIENAS